MKQIAIEHLCFLTRCYKVTKAISEAISEGIKTDCGERKKKKEEELG